MRSKDAHKQLARTSLNIMAFLTTCVHLRVELKSTQGQATQVCIRKFKLQLLESTFITVWPGFMHFTGLRRFPLIKKSSNKGKNKDTKKKKTREHVNTLNNLRRTYRNFSPQADPAREK